MTGLGSAEVYIVQVFVYGGGVGGGIKLVHLVKNRAENWRLVGFSI